MKHVGCFHLFIEVGALALHPALPDMYSCRAFMYTHRTNTWTLYKTQPQASNMPSEINPADFCPVTISAFHSFINLKEQQGNTRTLNNAPAPGSFSALNKYRLTSYKTTCHFTPDTTENIQTRVFTSFSSQLTRCTSRSQLRLK